jgi:uncharacterized protein YutE (UPF0331/DUF86 family)
MDTTAIGERLVRIQKCLRVLHDFQPMRYEEFAENYLYTDAAAYNFQTAIQAALDVGSIILADQEVMIPKRYSDIFPALAEIGVLPAGLAHKLVNMAKFRNVLVHLYLEVDLKRVYRYLQEDLGDFEAFARHVSEWLQRHPGPE